VRQKRSSVDRRRKREHYDGSDQLDIGFSLRDGFLNLEVGNSNFVSPTRK
jgi:hypothetical protein